MEIPVFSLIPFVIMLLCIAVGPLVAEHWWENNRNKLIVSLILGIPTAIWLCLNGLSDDLIHQMVFDYVPFIILLTALFTVTGGIHIGGVPGAGQVHFLQGRKHILNQRHLQRQKILIAAIAPAGADLDVGNIVAPLPFVTVQLHDGVKDLHSLQVQPLLHQVLPNDDLDLQVLWLDVMEEKGEADFFSVFQGEDHFRFLLYKYPFLPRR